MVQNEPQTISVGWTACCYIFKTFHVSYGCVWQLQLNQHDDDEILWRFPLALYIIQLLISYSVYLPKIIKFCCHTYYN